jgi:hypothetical protein
MVGSYHSVREEEPMFTRRFAITLAALAVAAAVVGQAAATFSEPITLSAAGREAFGASLAVDASGDAVFAWVRWDGANWRVQARARSAAGVLSPVQTLSAPGLTSLVQHVGVDVDGDAVITWTNTNNVVQVRARSAAGVLSPVQDLTDPSPAGRRPHAAIDPGGNAVFTWQHWDGSNYRVQVRARSTAGTLTSVQTLSAAGEHGAEPHVAVESDGDAIVTWSGGDRILARTRSAAGTLGAVETVGPAGLLTAEPQVAIDADGDAVFAWLRSDGTKTRVQARGRSKAGSLSPMRDLSGAGQDASFLRLAVDSGGNAVASWQRVDHPDVTVVQARRRTAAGVLSAVQTLSDADWTAEAPQVAVAPGGAAIVTWQRFDGASTRIQAAAGP